jgi:hypothetical protein
MHNRQLFPNRILADTGCKWNIMVAGIVSKKRQTLIFIIAANGCDKVFHNGDITHKNIPSSG